jgi:Glycosyl transferase family 2
VDTAPVRLPMIQHSATVAGSVEVVHLALTPACQGNVIALAALSDGVGKSRVFFNHAVRLDRVAPDADDFIPERETRLRGNGGVYVDGTLPDEMQETLTLTYDGTALALPLSTPRADLLSGQDCLLSTLNQALSVPVSEGDEALNPLADPAYIRGWLAHHARHQGVTAAVFLNRLGPGGSGADFARRLCTEMEAVPVALARIVVLDVPGPTGRLGDVDERHLLRAPDAPGRGRMKAPAPDPWRAGFGDEILLEFLRQAFFPRTNGVAYLDLSDWLSPPKEGHGTVFDAARAARPDPLIALTGLRAFAWKLPNSGTAHPGDHICRPFDIKAAFSRWVFCPAQGRDVPQVWRPHRIIGLEAQPAPEHRLWRFVGLRHPGAAPAQVVPKSSLREDAELLALSRDIFGHDPFRVPEPDIEAAMIAVPAAKRGDKIVLITAMKNEGPFLLEWIAYHRAIGVSDIIVFTNDCTDGTDTFLDLLAARGIVEHYPNPFREMGLKPQHAGFRAAEQMETVQTADWLMTLDVDEFINVHVGGGHLRDLFAAVGAANMISCTWRLFGNSDLAHFEDDFLLRQFTCCAAKSAARPHQAWGFKTLYQNNGIFRKLGVHRPKGLQGAAVKHLNWVNGSGRAMPEREFRSGWRSNTDTIGYDLVSLNHYAVRSTESFLVKRDRGRVNHVDRDQGGAYWFRMNHNTSEDGSIQRMIPMLEAEWARLMADPEIAAAHEHCVTCHRAKVAELMAQSEPRAFYDTLDSDRYRTLSRLLPAFGSNVFLAGPDSVPQDLVDQFNTAALPDDFYFTVDRPSDTKH